MDLNAGDVLPPDLAERLAASLRAPGAFAVDAATGVVLAPQGAAALEMAARQALLAFGRERGAGAALLDLKLSGDSAPPTPAACRLMELEDRRVVVVVPIDGGVRAGAVAPAPEPKASSSDAPQVRILWRSDESGALAQVGDGLRRIMGDKAGAVIGRKWGDLVDDVLLDPTGALEDALARRATASGVELLWSSDHAPGPVTTIWSGVPVYDAARRFRGFRGFLLAPDLAPVAAPAPPPVVEDEPAAPVAEPVAVEPAVAEEAPAEEVRAVEDSGVASAEPAAAPASEQALPAMPHLSLAERNAFREIARALGVRGVETAEPEQAATRAPPQLRLVEKDEPRPAVAEEPREAEAEPTATKTATPVDEALAYEIVEPLDDAPLEIAAPREQEISDAQETSDSGAATQPTAPAVAEHVVADESPAEEESEIAPESAVEASAQDEQTPAAEATEPEEKAAELDDGDALESITEEPLAEASPAEPEKIEQQETPPAPAGENVAQPFESSVDTTPAFVAAPQAANDVAPTPDAEEIEKSVAALAAAMKKELDVPAPVSTPIAAEALRAPMHAPPPDPLLDHARDILDRLPVGVLINRGPKLLFANRTLLDLLDYPSTAAIEAHGGVAGLFKGRAPLSERDGPTGPVLLAGRDGESIAVDARLQGLAWDGAPATLVTFRRSLDVEVGQRLKATELDLRAREAELRETRAMLDIATDGVAVIDEDGRIMTLNRAAEALFGYDLNEVAGESLSTLFAPESHALAADYFEGLKSGGVRSVLNDGRELVGRVRQGGRIPLFVTLGQISDKPTRKFCAVLRDLTPWKKTERDLVDARKAAEDASAQKSDFLAKISHEVRTPLNAIIGFAEVMMEERFGAVGNDRYKDYLRDIHSSGGHVISLVNDLLDLSKIEAGKLDLNFASVNANEIVRGAVSLMQPQSQRARVVLRSALAMKLPAIVADERALKQIVLNILSNAVKFTDSGGQVIVSTTLTDLGEVAIRIRDTGIGMNEKELSEAMEPFRQLATSRRAGGTGLGLPLTRALVEANRASLKLSSVKNEGTLVEVVFPPTRVLAE
ncbi:PAS domain-containing sensor histidine kinase [Terrarubrum flagellatum]|uniref:PAS domain-containing sensor histidine kinase n=1 Tax=Terrirubrum flagellatum TaxID=2895980 RepID=UPI003144FEBE